MFNIVIGLIAIVGGLSGEAVLLGTDSGEALIIVGGIVLAIGIYQVMKKND